MSLNSGITSKQQLRHDELERLTEAYRSAGGEITKKAGHRLNTVCTRCGRTRYLSASFAIRFKPACQACGAPTRIG